MREFTETGNLNRIALLGAFSMFLSTVEYLFPRPIPFMRLGLANLPLLLGLEVLSAPSYILLVILKVLGQALVNGTLASYVFLFSLSGSLGSALIMYFCYKGLGKRISFIGISLMGALASNTMQIALSVIFIFGSSAWRILPLFLGIGLVSGLLYRDFRPALLRTLPLVGCISQKRQCGEKCRICPRHGTPFRRGSGRVSQEERKGSAERRDPTGWPVFPESLLPLLDRSDSDSRLISFWRIP